MIVNNARRFIFVHVPKAAGTSTTRELSKFTTFRDVEVGGTQYGEKLQDMYAARFDLRKHSPASRIKAKAGPEVWRSYFVFAFVRNPYARAYSVWRFLCKWREGPHHQRVAAQSFEQFLSSSEVRQGDIEIARPQAWWLTEANGGIVEGIDFIGRVEKFDEDFNFILSTITRKRIPLRRVDRSNVSTLPEEWRGAITPAAHEAIDEIYDADFRLLGYDRIEQQAPPAISPRLDLTLSKVGS